MEEDIRGPDSADGSLVIYVVNARNLPNRRKFEKQDPYVTLRMGTVAQRTSSIYRGGQTPEWKERIEFKLHRERRPIMKLDVLDETKGDPTLIGSCEIDCAAVFQLAKNYDFDKRVYIHDKNYELQCNGQVHGSICLEMTFTPAVPVLPPKIKSESAIHSQKLISEEFPRNRYQESNMFQSISSDPQVSIDESTFQSGISSPSGSRSYSNHGNSVGSRPSLLGESGPTNSTSTANTSSSSVKIQASSPFDDTPKEKGILKKAKKVMGFFTTPPQHDKTGNGTSVWADANSSPPKSKFSLANLKRNSSPVREETSSSPFIPNYDNRQSTPPPSRLTFPQQSSQSPEFSPFPESNAGFAVSGAHSNYTSNYNFDSSLNSQSLNQSLSHSQYSTVSSSPKRKPLRKPPPDFYEPIPDDSAPFSADSIGLNTSKPLPVPSSGARLRDPDELEAAPQPTSQMNRDWRMKAGLATDQDLSVDYRTAQTGYTGKGKFSPNVFERLGQEYEEMNEKGPPVPAKIPLGMTKKEYYAVSPQNFMNDLNGRRFQ